MSFTIRYVSLIDTKALAKISRKDLLSIKNKIDQKLSTHPDLFGKPLRRSLRGYWSLRVDDYRVIYRIHNKDVLIFIIEHRSIVYEVARKLLEKK